MVYKFYIGNAELGVESLLLTQLVKPLYGGSRLQQAFGKLWFCRLIENLC